MDFINAIADTIIINIKRTKEMNCNIHYIHNDAHNLYDFFKNANEAVDSIEDEEEF